MPSRAAGQFANGDFASPASAACDAGAGWSFDSNGFNFPEHTDAFSPANFWIDLTPCGQFGNGTWIEQAVPTQIGQCYRLRLDLGTVCGWDGSDAGVFVAIDGQTIGGRIFNDTFSCVAGTMDWRRRFSPVFEAKKAATTVRFTGLGLCTAINPTCGAVGQTANPGVIGVDNVGLEEVGSSLFSVDLGPDTTFCEPFSLVLDAGVSGAETLWSTGQTSQTIVVSQAGAYSVWVKKGTGPCATARDTIFIGQAPTAGSSLFLGADTTFCGPFSKKLKTGLPGLPTIWSTGATSESIQIDGPGLFWAKVAGPCGAFSDSILIGQKPVLPLAIDLGRDSFFCGAVDLLLAPNAPPNAVFEWSTGSATASIAAQQPILFWVRVSGDCFEGRDSIILGGGLIVQPSVFLGFDTTFCAPFSKTIRSGWPTDLAKNAWSTGATADSIVVSQPGTYSVTIVENQCKNTAVGSITISQTLAGALDLGADSVFCGPFPSKIELSAGPTAWSQIVWSTGEIDLPTIEIGQAGCFWARAEDACGAQTDSICLLQKSPPPAGSVELGADATLCAGPIFLEMHAAPPLDLVDFSIGWSDGFLGQARREASAAGLFWVSISNECGEARDSVEVADCSGDYFLPNAFTPDGDGLNDEFRGFRAGDAAFVSMQIFDRWGELIFETKSENEGWDGRFRQKDCATDVFAVILKYRVGLAERLKKGDLTLIR